MPVVSLNSISNVEVDISKNPLTFSEWSSKNNFLSFNDKERNYRIYLDNYYKETNKEKNIALYKLKNDYIDLLKKLSVIFKDDEDFKRYTQIDFNSDTDLIIAIPRYAEKLKQISLFYLNKRNQLKNKNIEKSIIGSNSGIEKILYNKLLNEFTNNNYTKFSLDNPLITNSPDLSSIKEDFNIEIEELYSINDPYIDTESLNPFACLFNDICSDLTSTSLSGYVDPLKQIDCNYNTEKIESLITSAYSKYAGVDTYYISGGFYKPKELQSEITFNEGTTSFYWFSGRSIFDIPEGRFSDVKINDIEWNSTGSDDVDNSDTITVTIGNSVYGAWFQNSSSIETSGFMVSRIEDGKIFKFPFTNYGVSAYQGAWTGPSITDQDMIEREFYPSEEDFQNKQKEIYSLYWSGFSSISTVIPKNIQETDLGKTNGYANEDFSKSDKIIISYDNTTQKYVNPVVGWLFEFTHTQLPILNGDNDIYFPIKKYTSTSDLFFKYSRGDSVVLSSLNASECFVGAIAGETLETSDLLIKNISICGPEIEAAWLKSPPLKLLNRKLSSCSCVLDTDAFDTDWTFISGGCQLGLSFKVEPKNYFRFTWTGETTNINNVIGLCGFDHDDSCEYKKEDFNISLFDENFLDDNNKSLFERWKKCTCGAIKRTPFSVSGEFMRLGIVPDFIVKDVDFPNVFNPSIWKGKDNKNYLASKDSARFISSFIEKDGGWGKGSWTSFDQTDFILEKGQSYIFYRSTINNCNFESPYFIVNDSISQTSLKDENCENITNLPVWYKAIKNENDEWVDAGTISNMVLDIGDFVKYVHRDSRKEKKRKLLYNGQDVSSVSGSVVYLDPNDEAISFIETEIDVPSISFIINIPLNNNYPYWGLYKGKKYETVNDYLIIYQPEPLNIILDNNTNIEYRFGCGGECFYWQEPLKFNTLFEVKKWNKLLINDSIKSDILKYLNSQKYNCVSDFQQDCYSQCEENENVFCVNDCYLGKQGVSALYEDSDITFNVEISGLPVLLSYNAKSSFVQNFSIIDVTNGLSSLYVPSVSGLIYKTNNPWRELLNQEYSKFVLEEREDYLNEKDLDLFIPNNVGMNRYETSNTDIDIANVNVLSSFSYDGYFNNKIVKKHSKLNNYVFNDDSYLNGFPQKNLQNFTPYSTPFGKNEIGTFEDLDFSPWKEKDYNKYKNYRGQYNIYCDNGWSDQKTILSGDVSNWDDDIFGNNYFLVHDEITDFNNKPSSFGSVYVKNTNNKILNIKDALSSVFIKYESVVIDDYTYLTTEDGAFLKTEDGLYIIL